MSLKCRLLIAAVATVVSFNTYANTGNRLLEHCLAPKGSGLAFGCVSYVDGVADTLAGISALKCVPGEVNVGQMRDVGVRYLQAHPETRHRPAAELLIAAFAEAWPYPLPPKRQ
jgi:hypothetical protein